MLLLAITTVPPPDTRMMLSATIAVTNRVLKPNRNGLFLDAAS